MSTSQLGYAIFSKEMLQQTMGNVAPKQLDPMTEMLIEASLAEFGVPARDQRKIGFEYEGQFWSPPLQGNNIADHFEQMAKDFLADKLEAIEELARYSPHPQPPAELTQLCQAGWTRFSYDEPSDCPELIAKEQIGEWWMALVACPLEQASVLDTETYVQGGAFAKPIIATACNAYAQYIWLSPYLADEHLEWNQEAAPLVPIGRHKIYVMHNTGYDAVRVQERYAMHFGNDVWFLDTMSMHMMCSGLAGKQRWAVKAKIKPGFMEFGTNNALAGAWEFHVGGGKGSWDRLGDAGDKSLRNIFVKGSLDEIRDNLEKLLAYACNDPYRTHELFNELLPKYRRQAPSLVVLASHMLMTAAVVPVEADFEDWTVYCDRMQASYMREISSEFIALAKELFETCDSSDWWLSQLDWTPVAHTAEGKEVPAWYYGVLRNGVTTRQNIASYLLQLSYLDSPMRLIKKPKAKGWCCVVVPDEAGVYRYGNGEEADAGLTFWHEPSGCHMIQLPHKDGAGKNVGNPLSTSFSWRMRELEHQAATMKAKSSRANKIRLLHVYSTFWVGYANRVKAVGLKREGSGYSLIAPAVVPHNTASYRTGEGLFLTLPSRGAPRIGSDVKFKCHAPGGYHFVGFDFDSEELQLAGAYGDAQYGINGTNSFSYSILSGDKKKKTDPHSILATKASEATGKEVKRDGAKQAIYAMLYGAMAKTVGDTMRMWHPDLPVAIVEAMSKELISAFKGKRSYGSVYYSGGQASATFNKMHDLIALPEPSTPLLGTRMMPAMWPEHYGKMDAPDQLNWAVQSAGSAMLQCIVLATWWLAEKLEIKAHLALTIHDEIWTYCVSEHRLLWAYCLQIAHCWCWSLWQYQLGLYEMPAMRAFASGIAIDKIIRKDIDQDIATPTNKRKLPNGKEYSIQKLIELGMSDKLQERWEVLHGAD